MELKYHFTVETKDTLLHIIEQHNQAYRSGAPAVSDAEYDAEVELLKQLDSNNEWFKHIEPTNVSGNRKVKLPIPMKSLSKAKSLIEVNAWLNSLSLCENEKVVITPKFDGVSLLCSESLKTAYSRGGEDNEGQDCSEHVKMLKWPESNGCKQWNYVFGEFVFSREQWNSHFIGKVSPESGDKYKSPRNTAAGLINRDVASPLISHVDFFKYGIDSYSLRNFDTYQDVYSNLCEEYQQPMLMATIKIKDLAEDLLLQCFKQWSELYYIDGLVIYINDLDMWDRVWRHKTTGNPLYAIAYKHPDFTDTFDATVKDISWRVSKAGALKPVVNIDTVDTGDCNMENPAGYNAGWIADHSIAKGAKILVTRSGGVIPKIINTITQPTQEELKLLWDSMRECPSCGGPTEWGHNYIELYCSNQDCRGIKLAKMIFFYITCGAENVGGETVAKIYNNGHTSVKMLLNISFEDLMLIDGFGESTSNMILENNKRIAIGVDIFTLIHASDCFNGIGKVKAQKIIDAMSEADRNALYKLEYEPILPSAEIWDNLSKTRQSFESGILMFYSIVKELRIPILIPQAQSTNAEGMYAGMNVCFSGVRDSSLELEITSNGGCVSSSVNKKTTHLVVKDINSSSSKSNKAKELGISIILIENFIK